MNKFELLQKVKHELIFPQYKLVGVEELRPYGASYTIADEFTEDFVKTYFPGKTVEDLGQGMSLQPKFMIYEPGKRQSLQYHNRRAEYWRVVWGTLTAAISETDEEGEWKEYKPGDEIAYEVGTRHRAGAPEGGEWVVVAEIWRHTDPSSPSDEADIIRLADDFGRS